MEWNSLITAIIESGLFIILFVIMIVGVGISAVNSVGTWIVWSAMLIGGLIEGFDRINPWLLVIFFIITAGSTLIDNATMYVGAKRMGAGKWGIVGALVGGFVGLLIGSIVGAIVGPFIVAVLFELILEKKQTREALKAGFGTFLGFITAVALKVGVGISMVAIWVVAWFN